MIRSSGSGKTIVELLLTPISTRVRLGDYVVLPAKPSADQANAAALQESYDRTVGLVGKGDGFGPEF